ncbi:dienelactone hydrolase family protein [Paenibacillus hemerocallicola]|uniref:Dienelactone hydrolase family protein n=1 Tax=Paenibacillus hemerocallicola TaxID=1172614 RepID=A0A5C4SWG8_9BACL|nr:dienelactone hydrolase family protein [Paenibacillus hemerocallicola]TNJ56922.1 dienelactone hydrolase family protein [Paenibacillus hemerocallicola]
MGLHTEWIPYGERLRYSGYVARPEGVKGSLPSVIVLQEIWGVDEHIQDVTRRLAQAGYVAFAPDLFAEGGSRPEALDFGRVDAAKSFLNTIPQTAWRNPEERDAALSRLPGDEGKKVGQTLELLFNLGGRFPAFVGQAAAAAAFLRETYEPSRGQGVASVGFCLGGGLSAALAANDEQLRGAIIYYGSLPAGIPIEPIRAPLLGFYGENDKRITDAVPDFSASLKAAGKSFEYHVYPDAPHAFFNDTRPSYHVSSARDAFVRTLDFLRGALA